MLVSAAVNRPWLVRAVAMLLLLVGLQAGTFRDFDSSHQWAAGADDGTVAVLTEGRKADGDAVALQAAALPRPACRELPGALRLARHSVGARALSHHLPDPTGPPRA